MTHPHVATANHRTAPTLAVKVAAVARRAWQAYWDWRARQATIEILRALDSRTLRDIGLSRSEIESVVRDKHGERRRCYDAGWRGRPGA
jgi:uncharacterized protein YjiS (DUF1127 family)